VALRGIVTTGGGGSARVSERDEEVVLAVSRRRNRCWKEEMKETIREERQICPGVMGLWGKMWTTENKKNNRESRVRGLSWLVCR